MLTNSTSPNLPKRTLLHLLPEFPPYSRGGLGVAAKALCKELSKHSQVHIVIPKNPSNYFSNVKQEADCNNLAIFQLNDFQEQLFNTYATNDLSIHTATEAYASCVVASHFTGYDAIHAHDWVTADAGIALKRSTGSPLILHIHSTQLERSGLHARGDIYAIEKNAMQIADHVITVSEQSKTIIIEHYQIPSSKISVIHNASSPNQSPPTIISNQAPTILFAGRMEQQKSPLFATEVICETLKKQPNAKAIIAGEGTFLNTIRDIIKFRSLEDRVQVLGQVPHHQMPCIYSSADVLIAPSNAEPFGLVALEAALSNVAVILSENYGAGEIISSAPQLSLQDTGLWVDEAVRLLSNPIERHTLAQTHQSNIHHHQLSWSKNAAQLLDIVEQISSNNDFQ